MHTSALRILGRYRALSDMVGRPALLIALGARAPFAMVPLGAMTALTASSGSVATGGLATGVISVSAALASPLIGRWADRRGQRLVLLLLTPASAFALAALYAVAHLRGPLPALVPACVAVGATTLPIGSFTRARWVGITRTPHELATAFSYESMADELTFVLGPALVGVAASAATPDAPLLIAIALVLLATLPFATSAPGAPPPAAGAPDRSRPPRPTIARVLAAAAPALIVMIGIGCLFGSTQAATTARAEALGAPGRAGLVYALMGIGSAVMSLFVVVLPEAFRLPARILTGGLGISLLISLVARQEGLWATGLGLTAVGAFVGPTMVTAFSLAERLTPRGGVSVAMTSMSASVTVGVSLGSAVGGELAAAHGPAAAYGMGAVTGAVIAIVPLVAWAVHRPSGGVPGRHRTQVG
ncbi:MAG: MFS transporter [Actinomyces sp.]|nr:MFS transporter [Actinomyces sp.]MCI1642327.1 MFS transporter [Actinomyces sp.]MCI1662866.1 MFS transporter [Actinomyces sp.]MCI1691427.1 MFS transporter [Actinomyces sp.]MCI1830656.1 MFS transporter [Actinomyces sp.]